MVVFKELLDLGEFFLSFFSFFFSFFSRNMGGFRKGEREDFFFGGRRGGEVLFHGRDENGLLDSDDIYIGVVVFVPFILPVWGRIKEEWKKEIRRGGSKSTTTERLPVYFLHIALAPLSKIHNHPS